jgi:hypothetical protein
VADLRWEEMSSFFDPDLMGSLPDVRVPKASVEDWQAVLDLVAERGWKCQYSEGEAVLPVPRAEVVPSRPADAECPGRYRGFEDEQVATRKSMRRSLCGGNRAR